MTNRPCSTYRNLFESIKQPLNANNQCFVSFLVNNKIFGSGFLIYRFGYNFVWNGLNFILELLLNSYFWLSISGIHIGKLYCTNKQNCHISNATAFWLSLSLINRLAIVTIKLDFSTHFTCTGTPKMPSKCDFVHWLLISCNFPDTNIFWNDSNFNYSIFIQICSKIEYFAWAFALFALSYYRYYKIMIQNEMLLAISMHRDKINWIFFVSLFNSLNVPT